MTTTLTKRISDRPRIRTHVDGPYATFIDGTVHWLTPAERFSVALGFTNAEKLQAKHRPDLAA